MSLSMGTGKLIIILLLAWGGPAAALEDATQAVEHLKAGVQYIRSGNLVAAEQELRKALSLDSHNPEIYNLLGFVCDQTDRPDQAVENYQAALKLNPDFTAACNNLGASYLRQGKRKLAQEEFRRTLARHPRDLTANYNLGLIYLEDNEYEKARACLETARSVAPDDPAVLFSLAKASFGGGRREEGTQFALQALHGRENDPRSLFRVGALLLQNGLSQLAAARLARANDLSPHEPQILLALAEAHVRAGNVELAAGPIEDFIEAAKREQRTNGPAAGQLETARFVLSALRKANPVSFKTNYELAEVCYLEGKYREALDILSPFKATTDDPEYFNLLGMCHAGLNHFSDAANALIRALKLSPTRSDFLFNLASVYQKAGDNQSAIEILKRAISQGQSSPQLYFALGLAYFNLGQYSTAIETFQKALGMQPDFAEAMLLAGRSYERWGKRPEAMAAYRKAVSVNPSFYPAQLQLALLLLQSGKGEDAIPLLQEVVRLNPQSAEAYYQLGKWHAAQGHSSEAIQELEKTIALNPEQDEAYYQQGRLYAKAGNSQKAQALLKLVNERKAKRSHRYQEKVSGPAN
jgi:tetratricopeptide (TPR) repeat protein